MGNTTSFTKLIPFYVFYNAKIFLKPDLTCLFIMTVLSKTDQTSLGFPNGTKLEPVVNKEGYRNYEDSKFQDRVETTYNLMHKNQTVDFVKGKVAEYGNFDHAEMTMMEVLEHLNGFVDESDPDTDLPNVVHAFQTAERLREKFPDEDWLHLVGLIHDTGKILFMFGEPQWATVGDTFPVGCSFDKDAIVFPNSFKDNPDNEHHIYSTKYGMYSPNCGLNQVLFSWGHDEYLYRVLKNHPDCKIPEEGMYNIRFHSFYPWHLKRGYLHLCDDKDLEMIDKCRQFSTFDLYSKTETLPDIPKLMPYYQGLIRKYLGVGKIKW